MRSPSTRFTIILLISTIVSFGNKRNCHFSGSVPPSLTLIPNFDRDSPVVHEYHHGMDAFP